jgi:hypothetical protein
MITDHEPTARRFFWGFAAVAVIGLIVYAMVEIFGWSVP